MAKTRLNQSHRDQLANLVHKIVTVPAQEAALKGAYETAEPLVRAVVTAKFPPKDMAVLDKYGVAKSDGCIKLSGGSHVTQFTFAEGAAVPLVPTNHYCRPMLADEATVQAVETWQLAVKDHKEALKRKHADYLGLITASRTFEDIVEVWPEAEQLRGSICSSRYALAVVSPDIVERIKADVATRLAA